MPLAPLLHKGRYPLFAKRGSDFFLRVANVQIRFTRDRAGAVDALVLHQGGRDRIAARIR